MKDIQVFNIIQDVDYNYIQQNRKELLNNKVYINQSYPLYEYKHSLWNESPIVNDDEFVFLMQTLVPVSNLLAYYKFTEEEQFIDRALSLFYSWYEENFKTNFYKKDSSLIYALRLLVVCDLFTSVRKIDLCVLEDVFENVMLSHSAHLEFDKNYKKNDSQGLEQDIALFVASIVLYNYYRNPNFLNLKIIVKQRLTEQLNFLIHEDGSYNDHSLEMAYHIYIRLVDFYQFTSNYGESEELCDFIKNKLDHLLIFVYSMLEPGGFLPPIGISSYTKVNYEQFTQYIHPLNTHIHYIVTYGKAGSKLLYKNVLFKQANYFISVNNNEMNNQFIKLLFYSSYKVQSIKHYDHLSFILFYKDLPLFIDSGIYHNKEHIYHQSLNSLYSHNSICVDGHDYLIDKYFMNKSGITNVSIDQQSTLLSSVSLLYEDLLIRRTLLFIKNYYLIIMDEFDSHTTHQYEIIYNINPLISLNHTNEEFSGYYKNEKYFTLNNLFCTEEVFTSYIYEDKKNHRGYSSKNGYEVEPNHTIIFKNKGNKVLNISLIRFNESLPLSYQVLNKQINFKIGEDIYSVVKNKNYRYLHKNGELIHNDKTSNKHLLKSIHDFYKQKK